MVIVAIPFLTEYDDSRFLADIKSLTKYLTLWQPRSGAFTVSVMASPDRNTSLSACGCKNGPCTTKCI